MPVLLAFTLFLVGGLLLSALLVPWLQPLFEATLNASPDRSLYRFAMLLGLLGMPLLLGLLRLRGRDNMGFSRASPHRPGLMIGSGLLVGVAILAGLVFGLLLSGNLVIDPRIEPTLWLLLRTAIAGIASGLAVGLIEEFFFRGPMHTGTRRSLSFWPTALLTGTFYSAVHFIRPPPLESGVFDIPTALSMVAAGLSNLADIPHPDRFVALLVAGVFLSMVRERTGSIYWPIGIHAGWVMTIKITKRLTNNDPGSDLAFLVSADGITGWLSTAWMAAIAAAYWWWTSPARKKTEPQRRREH